MSTAISPPRLERSPKPPRLAWSVQKMLQNTTVRGVTVLTAGTAAAHLLAIGAAPVLTRLYTPADFGILSAFVALVGLLTTVGCMGYERAIPVPPQHTDALTLVALCGLILAGNTAVLFLVMSLFGSEVLGRIVGSELAQYAWLVAPACFLISCYEALTYYTSRIKAFTQLAWTKVYQGTGMVGCQLGCGLFHLGAIGLLLGDLAGRGLGIGALARPVAQAIRQSPKSVSLSRLRQLARRYWRFPALTLPSTLLNRTAFHLPKLIMAGVFAPSLLGHLMLADTVLHVPASLLGQNLARVYIGEFSERRRTRPESCARFFRKFTGWLCLLGLPPLVLVYLWGPILFQFVFGRDWEMAGEFARLLSPAIFLQFIMSPVSTTLFLSERQGLQFVWDVFYSTLVCGSVAAAAAFRWEPVEIVGVYAGTQGLAYLLQGILLFTIMQHRRYASEFS